MADTITKPADKQTDTPKGGNAVLEGLGAIFTRGSLTLVQKRIKEAENLMGSKQGPAKKKAVTAALLRDVTKRAPTLGGNPQLAVILDALVDLTVGEMNKAHELDASADEN